jgi:hypothetical protein
MLVTAGGGAILPLTVTLPRLETGAEGEYGIMPLCLIR